LSIIQKLIERTVRGYLLFPAVFRAENASCISDQFQPPRSFTHCSLLNLINVTQHYSLLHTSTTATKACEISTITTSMNKVMHISPSSSFFLDSSQFPALHKLEYLILGRIDLLLLSILSRQSSISINILRIHLQPPPERP